MFFNRDPLQSYDFILELIHEGFCPQKTSENLRDVQINPSSILCRGKSYLDRPNVSVDNKLLTVRKFPSNHGRLFPTHMYTQFKKWYEHMVIPPHQRTP